MSSEIPLIPPTDDDFSPAPPPRPPLTQEEADDVPRPKFWRRAVCWLVDMAVVIVLGVLVQHMVFGVEIPPDAPVPESEAAAGGNAEFVANAVIAFLYFGLLHGRFGASAGKWLGGIRVRRLDGGRAGYWSAFVRAFWAYGILAIPEVPRLLSPEGGFDLLSDAGALYILFNCLCLVWDRRFNRAFHDRLAGTRVVMRANS